MHTKPAAPPCPAGSAAAPAAPAACADLLDRMLPLDLDDDCLALMFGEAAAEEESGEGAASAGGDESAAAGTSSIGARARPALPRRGLPSVCSAGRCGAA